MSRLSCALLLLACLPLVVSGQEGAAKAPAKPEITLKIGDPGPKLQVTEWVRGSAVTRFEPGKTYVVEFWATWCGPCVAAMPHLSEVQEEYKDKGLTVVSLTSRDPNNSEEQVKEFVKARGENIMRYNVAWCADRSTNDAYMKAAGQNGIPCSFVVDGQGKVAYIGHPLILDEVLPAVIGGTWKGQADAEAASKKLDDFFKMLGAGNRNPEEGLKQFAAAEKATPKLAGMFADQKIMMLLRAKQVDQAEVLFTQVMERAVQKKDSAKLVSISRAWSTPQLNPEKKSIKLAVEAIEAAQKLAGPKDLGALITAAQVYDAAGEKEKAKASASQAIEASPNERAKEQIQRMMEKYLK